MSYPRCRLCSTELRHTFVDLGMSPPCESYLTAAQLDAGETFYPLHVRVCENCLLVQLPAYIPAEDIFSDYAYFSSYSDSWVAHARRFVEDAARSLPLGPDSFVVEVASNDGYLLQHVVARGIRALGVEPEGGPHLVGVALGVLDPRGGIRREVGVLGEDLRRRHVGRDLGQQALVADLDPEREERLHLVQLVGGEEALAQR